MTKVKVVFDDWNGVEHIVNITDDMYPNIDTSIEEKCMVCAIRYIKRRYTEYYKIRSVEIIY